MMMTTTTTLRGGARQDDRPTEEVEGSWGRADNEHKHFSDLLRESLSLKSIEKKSRVCVRCGLRSGRTRGESAVGGGVALYSLTGVVKFAS